MRSKTNNIEKEEFDLDFPERESECKKLDQLILHSLNFKLVIFFSINHITHSN